MIQLTDKPTKPGVLPPVYPTDGLTQGTVFVGVMTGDALISQLPNGVRSVLLTRSQERGELITRNKIGGAPTAAGTYLSAADFAKINDRLEPALRRYLWTDTWAKARSSVGILVLVPAALALATAVASIVFLIFNQSAPSAGTTADKAQAILEWSRQPINELDSANHPTDEQIAAARIELDRRVQQASFCLQSLQGHEAPPATIPGITCSSAQTAWWQSASTGSLVTGSIAIITALLGLVGLQNKFGFQKSPAS